METLGVLNKVGGRFEYRQDDLSLVVRGDFAEWVLAAAAELLASMAKREVDSQVEELETLCEFGEAEPIDLDSAKFDARARFEVIPQCTVTVGAMDYRWIAPEGRDKASQDFDGHPIQRIHDMALTRNDTFLKNEDGVDTTN